MKGMWQQGKKRIKKFRTGIKIQYSIKGYHKFQHHNLIFHQANLGKPLETVKAPNTIFFFSQQANSQDIQTFGSSKL